MEATKADIQQLDSLENFERDEFINNDELSKEIFADYNIEGSGIESLKSEVKKSVTSPTLEKEQKRFSISDLKNKTLSDEDKDRTIEDFDEDKLNEEIENMDTSLEDLKQVSDLLWSGLDFGFDKVLINFFNKQPNDTAATKKKLERIKTLSAKVFQKWGLRMNIETILLLMIIGFGSSKIANAKKIEEGEEKNKKKSKEETKYKTTGKHKKKFEEEKNKLRKVKLKDKKEEKEEEEKEKNQVPSVASILGD